MQIKSPCCNAEVSSRPSSNPKLTYEQCEKCGRVVEIVMKNGIRVVKELT